MAVPVQTAPRRRGRAFLPTVAVSEPSLAPQAPALQSVDVDLREYLREWRRTTAKRQSVPAYVVMHDTSLEELCRVRPGSTLELRAVTGFGERKVEQYGEQILQALADFERGARPSLTTTNKTSPAEETLRLLAEGKTLAEISSLRERQLSTVVGTVASLVEAGDVEFNESWVKEGNRVQIEAACARLGTQWLKPLKEALPADITFEDVRLVVARLRRKEFLEKQSASA
jgi:ATP-dependent DNA helicase RecQ